MTPTAVLVLVAGVLVVLAVAGAALALDARRKRAEPLPAFEPPPPAWQTEPIDTVRAQVDPPTVATRADQDDIDPAPHEFGCGFGPPRPDYDGGFWTPQGRPGPPRDDRPPGS